MSNLNTLPQNKKSFDRFEGQDHATRGTKRDKYKTPALGHIEDPIERKGTQKLLRAIHGWELEDRAIEANKRQHQLAQHEKAIEADAIREGVSDRSVSGLAAAADELLGESFDTAMASEEAKRRQAYRERAGDISTPPEVNGGVLRYNHDPKDGLTDYDGISTLTDSELNGVLEDDFDDDLELAGDTEEDESLDPEDIRNAFRDETIRGGDYNGGSAVFAVNAARKARARQAELDYERDEDDAIGDYDGGTHFVTPR
jgi:hypothetical protein